MIDNHVMGSDVIVTDIRLPDHIIPKILRTPLHELALAIKLLQLGDVEQFLGRAMEKPSQQSITEALVTSQGNGLITYHLCPNVVENSFPIDNH